MTGYLDKNGIEIDREGWEEIVEQDGLSLAHDAIGELIVISVWDGENKFPGDEIYITRVLGADVRGYNVSTEARFGNQRAAAVYHRETVARLQLELSAVKAGMPPLLADGVL